MSKRRVLTSGLLAFLMIFAMMGSALAGFCTSCGTSLPADAKFCFNCGVKQSSQSTLQKQSTMTVTGVTENSDGSVTLRWSDSAGNSPYTVKYEFLNPAPDPFHWYNDTNSRSFTFSWLVPGVDYIFTVEDSKGNEVEYEYNAPRPYRKNEISMRLTIDPKCQTSSGLEDVLRLEASDIMNRSAAQSYGVQVKLNYSQLAKERNFHYKFCIVAPNGYAEAVWGGTMELRAGRSYLNPWFIPLDDFFDTMLKYYDEIPVGDYVMSFYYDDIEVLSEIFYVGN